MACLGGPYDVGANSNRSAAAFPLGPSTDGKNVETHGRQSSPFAWMKYRPEIKRDADNRRRDMRETMDL